MVLQDCKQTLQRLYLTTNIRRGGQQVRGRPKQDAAGVPGEVQGAAERAVEPEWDIHGATPGDKRRCQGIFAKVSGAAWQTSDRAVIAGSLHDGVLPERCGSFAGNKRWLYALNPGHILWRRKAKRLRQELSGLYLRD